MAWAAIGMHLLPACVAMTKPGGPVMWKPPPTGMSVMASNWKLSSFGGSRKFVIW